jgi:hypothetical protein
MIGHILPKPQAYTYQKDNYFAISVFFPYKFLADIIINHKANIVEYQLNQKESHDFIVKTFYSKTENKTFIYFINTNNAVITLDIPKTKTSVQVEYIHSKTLYGNTGAAAYLKTNPEKNNLIEYKKETYTTKSISIAPYSLGVISF